MWWQIILINAAALGVLWLGLWLHHVWAMKQITKDTLRDWDRFTAKINRGRS